MTTIIRISATNLAEVKSLFLLQHKKIAAIKHARSTGLAFPPGAAKGERPSLRDTKHAVEALDMGAAHGDAAKFVTFPRIAGVILDTGDGRVMVDLDGLQLQLLGDLQHLPIEVLSPSLELLQYLREWGNVNNEANS